MPDKDRRHIALVVLNLKPYGGQRVALNLAAAMSADTDVSVITLEVAPRYALEVPRGVNRIELKRAMRGPIGFLLLSWQLARVYDRQGFDGIISFMTFANMVAVSAALLSRRRPPVVVTEHSVTSVSLPAGERNARVLSLLLRHLYPQARAIVAVSDAGARDLIDAYRLPANRVHRIYNPLDAAYVRSQAVSATPHAWITAEPDAINLICVAMLKAAKGHWTLFRALALLPPNYRLLLVGDGPLEAELRLLATDLHISNRICFAGWADNPYPSVAAADMLVLASEWEGFGLVALEAAALGKHAVVTAVGGLVEVAELVGASTVAAGDPAALAAAISRTPRFAKDSGKWQAITDPHLVTAKYLELFGQTS